MGMFEMICTVLDRVRKHGEDFERIHTALTELKQEIQNVSTTLSSQLDAVTASLNASLTQLSVDISSVAAEVSTLVGELTPGSTLTQAQIDALTAINTGIDTLDASVKAIPLLPSSSPADATGGAASGAGGDTTSGAAA